LSNVIKKISYLRIVVEEDKTSGNFRWKLIKVNSTNLDLSGLRDQQIINSGSEQNLEEALKEAKFAFYNTN
jgi:hypothetical protein